MPLRINVAGPAEILIANASDQLATLGYTRDGAQLVFRVLEEPIQADSRGGSAGGRRDTAILDEECDIILRLTKYDPDIATRVFHRRNEGGVDGRAFPAGTLLIASRQWFRLLIKTPELPYNFPRVLFRSPIELNRGTRYSEMVTTATAYRDDTPERVLWNRSTG